MTKVKKLLPIGSVVILNNAEKRLMITGIMQTAIRTEESKEMRQEYDYVGVLYPEGSIGKDVNFLFNSEDIKTIFFVGFEDIERQTFIQDLENKYQEK